MTTTNDFQTRIRESFPEAAVDTGSELGADVLTISAPHIVDAARVLRDDFGFDMLLDITVVDWVPREPRYDVHYQMLNVAENRRLRVKVQLPDSDSPHVPSVVDVWPAAEWYEREVYDFFGVIFDGHPYLRRIFMPDEWIGYPLRKDYPVGGVPVEYKIEPAYVGANLVPSRARPAAGGVPARLRRDRGRQSHWTWTGPPASDVRRVPGEMAATDEPTPEEKAKDS